MAIERELICFWVLFLGALSLGGVGRPRLEFRGGDGDFPFREGAFPFSLAIFFRSPPVLFRERSRLTPARPQDPLSRAPVLHNVSPSRSVFLPFGAPFPAEGGLPVDDLELARPLPPYGSRFVP